MLHLVLKLITQIMQYILLICDRYSLKGAGGCNLWLKTGVTQGNFVCEKYILAKASLKSNQIYLRYSRKYSNPQKLVDSQYYNFI